MKYLFSFIIFVISFSGVSKACICSDLTLEQRINRHSIIVTGKAISIKTISNEKYNIDTQLITFLIDKKFRSDEKDTLHIVNDLGPCSFYFKEGESYLVFAANYMEQKLNEEPEIIIRPSGICAGTGKLTNSERLMRLLNQAFSVNIPFAELPADTLYNHIWSGEVFDNFDQEPEFPYGIDSLNLFIQNNLKNCELPERRKWPKETLLIPPPDSLDIYMNDLELEKKPSTVYVGFEVSNSGQLSNFEIWPLFSLNDECNENAIQLVKKINEFTPAKIKGVSISTTWFVSIDYKTKTAY
tara:strand:- start:5717 stop:6610 length:894 start_codon:yes stop_codon:yes gene_type:complete